MLLWVSWNFVLHEKTYIFPALLSMVGIELARLIQRKPAGGFKPRPYQTIRTLWSLCALW